MIDVEVLKDISYDVVGAIHEVHQELGPGLNEYVYQEGLAMELEEDGIPFEREKVFHPSYHGRPMKAEYRLDFLCDNSTIVECKSIQKIGIEQRAQLFNYMRLCEMPVGILVNFAPRYAEIERYFYDAETKEICGIDGISISKFRK